MITVNSYQCYGLSFKTQAEAETYCSDDAARVKPSAEVPRHQLVWAEDDSGNLVDYIRGIDHVGIQLYRSEEGLLPRVDKGSPSSLGWMTIGSKVWVGRETKAQRPVSYRAKSHSFHKSVKFKTRAEAEYTLEHNYRNAGVVEEVYLEPTHQLLWYHKKDLFGSAGGLLPSDETHQEWESQGRENETWCAPLETPDFEDKATGGRPILLEVPKSYKIQGLEEGVYYSTREEAEYKRDCTSGGKRLLVVGCSEEPTHQLISNGDTFSWPARNLPILGSDSAPLEEKVVKSYGSGGRRFRTREEAELRASELGLSAVIEYGEEPNSQLVWSEQDGVENDGPSVIYGNETTFYGSREGLLPKRYHGCCEYTDTHIGRGRNLSFKREALSDISPSDEKVEHIAATEAPPYTYSASDERVDNAVSNFLGADAGSPEVKSYGIPSIRFGTREEADLWWEDSVKRGVISAPREEAEIRHRVYPREVEAFDLPKDYHGWCGLLQTEVDNDKTLLFAREGGQPLEPPVEKEEQPSEAPLWVTSWFLRNELGSATFSDGTSIDLSMGPSKWLLVSGALECNGVRITAEQLKELAESGVKSYAVVGPYTFRTSIEASLCAQGAVVLPSVEEPQHQLSWWQTGTWYGSEKGLLPKNGTFEIRLLGDPGVTTVLPEKVDPPKGLPSALSPVAGERAVSYGGSPLLRFKTRAEAEVYLSGLSDLKEYDEEANAQLIWAEVNGESVDFSEPKAVNCEVYGSKDGLLPKGHFTVHSIKTFPLTLTHPTYEGSPIHTARVTGYRVSRSDFKTRAEAEIWSAYLEVNNGDCGENVEADGRDISIHPLTTKVDSYHQLMWGENEKGEVISPFTSSAKVYGSSKGLLPPKGLFDSKTSDTRLFTVRLDYSPRNGPVLLERSESGSMSWLGAFGFLALLGLVGKASTKGAGVRQEVKALDQEDLGVDESLDSARREHSR